MATIDQIKKHYDKLTDPERFALMRAAIVRADDTELKELHKSAPRKHWSFPSTQGLAEGFQFADMWYMMEQQADLMLIFWMFHTYSDTFETFDIVFEGHKIQADAEEIVGKLISRVLTRAAAWMDLCQEYKLDPEAELQPYPRYDEMMLLIGILDAAAGEMGEEAQPSQDEIKKALEGMRGTIDHFIKDWT
jgi:hypothetical protein